MIDDDIEKRARELIMELMIVCHKYGINEIHMGGLMRLVGVSDEKARECDDERVVLDERFTKYLNSMLALTDIGNTDQTLH